MGRLELGAVSPASGTVCYADRRYKDIVPALNEIRPTVTGRLALVQAQVHYWRARRRHKGYEMPARNAKQQGRSCWHLRRRYALTGTGLLPRASIREIIQP